MPEINWRARCLEMEAVIERVRVFCDGALSAKVAGSDSGTTAMAALAAVIKREALAASPSTVLAEHDARVLEEAADAVIHDLNVIWPFHQYDDVRQAAEYAAEMCRQRAAEHVKGAGQ